MRLEKRMTLDEISKRLAIGKTTVWYWIKDLPLAPPGRRCRPQSELKRGFALRGPTQSAPPHCAVMLTSKVGQSSTS